LVSYKYDIAQEKEGNQISGVVRDIHAKNQRSISKNELRSIKRAIVVIN